MEPPEFMRLRSFSYKTNHTKICSDQPKPKLPPFRLYIHSLGFDTNALDVEYNMEQNSRLFYFFSMSRHLLFNYVKSKWWTV